MSVTVNYARLIETLMFSLFQSRMKFRFQNTRQSERQSPYRKIFLPSQVIFPFHSDFPNTHFKFVDIRMLKHNQIKSLHFFNKPQILWVIIEVLLLLFVNKVGISFFIPTINLCRYNRIAVYNARCN